MKTALIEDVLILVPAIVFLVAGLLTAAKRNGENAWIGFVHRSSVVLEGGQ